MSSALFTLAATGIRESQYANCGEVGVSRGDGRLRCWVGTPFEKSAPSLLRWFYATDLLTCREFLIKTRLSHWLQPDNEWPGPHRHAPDYGL